MMPHTTNRIRKGRQLLVIPNGFPHFQFSVLFQLLCDHCNQRKQTKQTRRCATYRLRRPLPVCFNSQVPSCFFKGDFHLPALDKPFDDSARRGFPFSAEQGLRFKLPRRVSNNYPPNRHGLFPDVIPHAFAADYFYFPVFSTIPTPDNNPLSLCFPIINNGLQRRQSHTFFSWSSHLSRLSGGGFFIQRRIEAQAGHDRYFVFDRS